MRSFEDGAVSRYRVTSKGRVKKCPKKCGCSKMEHYRTRDEAVEDARAGVVFRRTDDGVLQWLANGVRHRGGNRPALIRPDGMMYWYESGVIYRSARPLSKKELKRYGKKRPKFF